MNITIADVAREAGVSKSTVSNYMNERFEKMSYETRAIIEKTIHNMGYVPNISARRLSNKQKSQTICLIIPGNITRLYDSMYYPTVLHEAEKITAEKGYKMLIYSRGSNVAKDELRFLKEMASSLVDGFMVFDLNEQDMFFLEFEEAKIPYICAGYIGDHVKYNYVASDHGKAMYDSLKYLTQIGHEKIGIFIPEDSSVVAKSREQYKNRFCEHEHFDTANIVQIPLSVKSTEKEVQDKWRSVLTDENRPSAFLITNAMRAPLLLAIQELGLRIPEDISYINLEYYVKTAMTYQEQTRVESKADKIVSIMFQELMKQIYEPENNKRQNIMVPLSLIIGETTAPPKKDTK